jgi:3'-phosphoadenosine 5'-phosphosulfate sulfotransferase (PAPS reductase)/FAD synthetase
VKYICSWSGGKDSTASIILAHENKEPLDTIIFSEVLYDKEKNISGENPAHMDFVKNKAIPLFKSWGYEVLIVQGERDYLDVFHRIIKHPRKHMDHKGKKYGFAISGLCSVKRDCKLKPIKNYYKSLASEYIEYVGIAINEPRRLKSLHKDNCKISLLEKYHLTENMARELCIKYGLLSPIYEYTKRNGCWFCPNAKYQEQKDIKLQYPEIWKDFVSLEDMDNLAQNKWNVFGETLKQRDKKLNSIINFK